MEQRDRTIIQHALDEVWTITSQIRDACPNPEKKEPDRFIAGKVGDIQFILADVQDTLARL